ncbi:cytochrome P450 9e2-like [Tribolium madens]|uniref:cytochrome P450 9e2-like n=1 Tax=Tribolium madens TaxID=41895 RepID=UPI001CF764D3|nr:cytochrome P450 9e2-like [Tribolium madens]
MLYVLLGALLALFIYYKIVKPAKFWDERGVTHEPALPLVGNFLPAFLRRKHPVAILTELYQKYRGKRYVGFLQFNHPFLMVRDINLVKQLTVKDFDSFHDHFPFNYAKNDPILGKSLLLLSGQNWKQMRATLSPAFTANKMKNMYQLMTECAKNFVGHFKGKEKVAVEVKDIFTRFTTDVIASTAFGIKTDSLNEPNNRFFLMAKTLGKFGLVQIVKMLVSSFVKIGIFPKDVVRFFGTIIKNNIFEREQNGIVRPDMIHLLVQARKGQLKYESSQDEGFAVVQESQIGQKFDQKRLTDDDIVAQAMTFFFAGFETVATASSFMAYELAIHPEIQRKLQEEIDFVGEKCEGKASYETLLSMKYLDQVVCESLRMWPPGFQIERMCTKNYKIPPKNPNEKEVVLEEGMSLIIPVFALHHDPDLFPEPDKFDPERFSEANRTKIVPGSYLPFGLGPRNCIASRFALLEIKTLFFHLLSRFDIVAIDTTQIPLKLSTWKVQLEPEKGFRLGIKPRKVTIY